MKAEVAAAAANLPLREQVQPWKATQETAPGPNSTIPGAEPGAERSKAADRNLQVRLAAQTRWRAGLQVNLPLRQHLYILGLNGEHTSLHAATCLKQYQL